MSDDVIRGVRAAREAFAAAHGYDLAAMVATLQAKEAAGDRRVIRYAPPQLTPMQLRILKVLATADRWMTRDQMQDACGEKGYSAALGAPRGAYDPESLEARRCVLRRGLDAPFEYVITPIGQRILAELEARDGPVPLPGEPSAEAVAG